MAKLGLKKLKSSTLLEVVIAMVVIMIVFVFSMGIYANIVRSSPTITAQRYSLVVSELIQQSIIQRNWQNESILSDSVKLDKIVSPYKDYPDLLLISVTATNQGKLVASGKQLVKIKADEYK